MSGRGRSSEYRGEMVKHGGVIELGIKRFR